MVNLPRYLILVVASTSIVVGQSQQEKPPRSKYWPWEVQAAASIMGYDIQKATGPTGLSEDFSPTGPRLAPSFRLSIDPISLPFGSILFSVGYRLENDVPLEYTRPAYSKLRHKSQLMYGVMLRFETSTNFEFGAGLDMRQDWMRAPHRWGTFSDSKDTRPWLRANARYMFDRGTNVTPFIGVEAGYALSTIDVDPVEYYRDYAINTGDQFLGTLPSLDSSPASFTRGHYPVWEGALVAGIRFGRHGAKAAPAAKPAAREVVREQPVMPDPDAARRAAEDEARRAAEAARLAADAEAEAAARREAEAARRALEEEARRAAAAAGAAAVTQTTPVRPTEPVKPTEPAPVAATSKSLADQIKEEGFKSLIVHFATNSFSLTDGNRAAVDRWVKEVWNDGRYSTVFNPNQLLAVGHCDETGAADVNQELSENRAKTIADYLRSKHGINVTNTKGLGQSKPISQNLSENRYSQVYLNSDDRRNAEFRGTKVTVKGPLVH